MITYVVVINDSVNNPLGVILKFQEMVEYQHHWRNLFDGISNLKKSIDGNLLVYGGATLISNMIDAN